MRYLILEKQEAGCDYTIGCGMLWRFEEFSGTLKEAKEFFTLQVCYPDGFDPEEEMDIDGDNPHEELWIVPAADAVQVDLEAVRREDEYKRRRAKLERNEELERAEYERLKRKYEK